MDGNVNNVTAYNGTYSTFIFAEKAQTVIRDHAATSPDSPMFLYLAFQSMHAPLQAPQAEINKFSHIANTGRRTVAAVSSLVQPPNDLISLSHVA